MKIGTKSLLFGSHQFLWHPFTLLLAWIYLYGHLPNWKTGVCIFIHDWGYWGCPNMEGQEGMMHPRWAAMFANRWIDRTPGFCYRWDGTYSALCLFHSRTYADHLGHPPSKLCRVDKLSAKYERWWTYLPRVWLSGELKEYREEAARSGVHPATTSDREWFNWARERMIRKALNKDARPPYQENS